jgi:hypothetical protein
MSTTTTTPGGTIITIPANSVWRGSVSLCATLAVAVGGSAATQFPEVVVSGTQATWADGDTVLKLALFVPAVGLTALTGSQVAATINTGMIFVQTRANAISLIMNHGTGVTAAGTAIGEVL